MAYDEEVIFDDIRAERKRQVAKWGDQRHEPLRWNGILGEEVGEVAKEVTEMKSQSESWGVETPVRNSRKLRNELIQVAAVCVAWLRDLPPREED